MEETKIKPNQIDVDWNSIGGGEPGVYYKQDEDNNLMACISAMENANCNTVDLKGESIVSMLAVSNKNFKFRNGEINAFQDGQSYLINFQNCNSIIFENIHFSGIFSDNTVPVFNIVGCNQILFKNCRFDFEYNVQKTIFRLENSKIYFENCSGNIAASDFGDIQNIEFGCKFIETFYINNMITIYGNNNSLYDSTSIRISNDLPQDPNQQYNIEQIFIDGSQGQTGVMIRDFQLTTHGSVKQNNGWKALVFQILDESEREIVNSNFGQGSFNLVPGKTQGGTDLKLYSSGTSYNQGDVIYKDNGYGLISVFDALTNFIASGDIDADITNNYLTEKGYNPGIGYINNTTYGYIANNTDWFLNGMNRGNELSTSLYNLANVNNDTEQAQQNDMLIFQYGQWHKISLSDLKTLLDSLN